MSLLRIVFVVIIGFATQGCSSDDFSQSEEVKILSNEALTVIDSRELKDFCNEADSFASKLSTYMNTLSDEEYNEFMANINNEEYIINVISSTLLK